MYSTYREHSYKDIPVVISKTLGGAIEKTLRYDLKTKTFEVWYGGVHIITITRVY